MRRVLLLVDERKADASELLAVLRPWLESRVESVEVHSDVLRFDGERVAGEAPPDLAVVLGGDGSILAAVRAFKDQLVPVLGINFGRVGFLASVDVPHWQSALEDALAGRIVVERRLRLEARVRRANAEVGPASVALNDIVVTRAATQGLLSLALFDGDDWVTNYRADGLIVASPSGSTAHSLAAGGPLLAPSVQAWIVVPICPHALSHRPIVLATTSVLTVRVERSTGLTTLAVDGHSFVPLSQGDSFEVRRCAADYPLLSPRGLDPYRRIRERLGWSGDVGGHDGAWDGPNADPGAEPGFGEML